MNVLLSKVKLSIVECTVVVMDMVGFFFVDENIPVDARYFAHQVKCLARLVAV